MAQGAVSDGRFVYQLTYFGVNRYREAILTGVEPGYNPTGTLVIPDSVMYENKNYPVVMLGDGDYGVQYPAAFDGFEGITAVHIPASIRSIANKEFINCPNIERYEVAEGNTHYKTDNGSLIELMGEDDWTFFKYPSGAKAKTFCVPVEYEDILAYAFAANNHLKVLQIVGTQDLWNGWQLGNRCIERIDPTNHNRNYSFEDGALYWGSELVSYCPGNIRASFTPRDGTVEINHGAFCEAPIRSITIPESVTKFGTDMTFMNSDIENLILPENMPLQGAGTAEFANCRNLKSVKLGCRDTWNETGVLTIYENAFLNCESLESITLAPEIKTIQVWYRAFMNCRSLKEFPATSKMKITSCRSYAFAGCESLTTFPWASLQDIDDDSSDGHQFEGSGLTQVNWPSGLPIVPPECFRNCKDLKKVSLKMSTTKLGLRAFANSGLTALSMMGVTNWWGDAFENCSDFMRLYFPSTDSEKAVTYRNVPFIAENAQVIVNNPNIESLDNQEEEYPADLYISMLNGGVRIGDAWSKVFVPGRASELYRNLTSSSVTEMYSYETFPQEGAVEISNLAAGVKIKSVTIEGREATGVGTRYYVDGLSVTGDKMNVTVNYTVANNPMSTSYEWVYAGMKEIEAIADADGIESWYNLSGLQVDNNTSVPGIYIVVKNGTARKVLVK